ncbi:hypothetical protein Tco_1565325 [Tanacetum coccineum]
MVSESWGSVSTPMIPSVHLKNKLNMFRLAIKSWTTCRVSAQHRSKEEILRHLIDWDVRAEDDLINESDVLKREEWLMDLSSLEQIHRDDLRQKCQMRWAIEGDENTCFFHSLLKNNYAKFSMKGVSVNGFWLDSPDEIKKVAIDHFSSRFKENDRCRPSFYSSFFRKLCHLNISYLESSFSMKEIKCAV